MARLHPDPYPMPDSSGLNMPVETLVRISQEALNAIPQNKLYIEPYADGHAYYFVVSERPLTLQHIPYLDAWTLSDARIRALTLKDVKRNIGRRELLLSIFGQEK